MGCEIEWMTSQSEYRPTEYLQGWLSFWFNEAERLNAAKKLQCSRIDFLRKVWSKDREFIGSGFNANDSVIDNLLQSHYEKIDLSKNPNELLLSEAQLTKQLYKIAAQKNNIQDFKRERESTDKANAFLNHGNYLAYGLAATTLWVLGIPHGFAVMHGKTRRGALVFDVADLVKDALVLPLSFICASENATEQEFRQQCLQAFTDHKALDFMFNQIKALALKDNIDTDGNTEL